jgi:hypothetical protein
VTLYLLHSSPALIDPALRLEFLRVIAPQRRRAIQICCGDGDRRTFGDVEAVYNLACGGPQRNAERHDIIGLGLISVGEDCSGQQNTER